MPVLTIEIVTRPGEIFRSTLAAELADRAGEVFGSPPGGTWVKLYLVGKENYTENGGLSDDLFPVFVSVLKAKLPSREVLQAEMSRLTAAVALACGRPEENVHILYLPEGAGRAAFGGKLIQG